MGSLNSLAWGNIYAPQWMGVSPGIAGYDDREHDLDLPPVSVAAATVTKAQPLELDSDADFLVRGLEFVILPGDEDFGSQVGPLDLRVRIRDGNGRLFTSDFIPIVDLRGPFSLCWPLERGAVLNIEYQNLNATRSAQVQMILKGYKRVPCPGRPAPAAPAYVPMYRRYAMAIQNREIEDFEYPFTFTSPGAAPGQDLLRIPIQMDNDADFLWRGLAGDWATGNNDNVPVGLAWVRFYDLMNTPLSDTGLIVPWGSQNAAMPRENVFSNGGGRMAPQFPEMFVPRGGVVQIDISFGFSATPAQLTLRGSLRGVKVYDGKGAPCR